MDSWIERYADALAVGRLDEDETRVLLALAREVAHGSERRFAPLATFLAGYGAGRASGDRRAAIDAAASVAGDLLADAEDTERRHR